MGLFDLIPLGINFNSMIDLKFVLGGSLRGKKILFHMDSGSIFLH